ncbi:MAG: AAA family ATPase [Ottowia sp.]|nr:AAA family ATPase [Ottowia sp.]
MNDTDRARAALQSIPPDCDRDTWVRAGMAAHAAGLDFEDFDSWSAQAGNYDARAARDTWRSFKPGKGVGAGTLHRMAGEHGHQQERPSKPPKRAVVPPPAPRPGMAPAEVWARCEPATWAHGYIERKAAQGVPLDTLRVVPAGDSLRIGGNSMAGALAVPAYAADGTLQSLQLIPPQGKKMNLPGAPMAGASFTVGERVEIGRALEGELREKAEARMKAGVANPKENFPEGVGQSRDLAAKAAGFGNGNPLYIVEGIGQAWAIWQATGRAAVVCFGWGNVAAVAKQLQGRALVLVPDAGKEPQAETLARELGCSVAAMPQGEANNFDANDLLQRDGADVLAALLESAAAPEPAPLPLSVSFADELPPDFTPPDELLQGVLTVGAASILYGDSNSGKTFAAVDMACAVARGDEWMGRRTEPGLVVYLAAESPASLRSRLQAYQQHHGVRVPDFAIVANPVDLFASDGDTTAIVQTVREIERRRSKPARLVIGDTLARLSAGANENSGEDMGLVVKRIDAIREATGAHFLVIHHSGKNAANGARGWSGIRAAVDTELEVTDSPQGRCIEITKQRDLSSKGERIGFRLEPVTLGTTKWGTPATSCIVQPADAPAKAQGKRMGEVEGAVVEYLAGVKVGTRKSEVVKHFAGRYEKGPVYRAMKALVTAAAIHEAAGMVCIAEVAK